MPKPAFSDDEDEIEIVDNSKKSADNSLPESQENFRNEDDDEDEYENKQKKNVARGRRVIDDSDEDSD